MLSCPEGSDLEARRPQSYRDHLAKEGASFIGGTPQEQRRYFDEVIAKYPECYWTDGCAPPTVKNHVISFRLKQGAKPVARQPIPVSPYDDLRVEFHIEENVAMGRLRKAMCNRRVCQSGRPRSLLLIRMRWEPWVGWFVLMVR